MFYRGYRPASFESHKTTLEFMRLAVEPPMSKNIDYFDRVRKKRHRIVYDEAGLISDKEAHQLLRKASELLAYVEERIKSEG